MVVYTIMIKNEVVEVPVTLLLYVDSFINGKSIKSRTDAMREIIAEHKIIRDRMDGLK